MSNQSIAENMANLKSEAKFNTIRENLYTPVVGDILDLLGYRHQFLPPEIKPMEKSMKLVGIAMPVLIADVYENPAKPFGRLTEALDSLLPGEIYLAKRATLKCASWGEILTVTAKNRSANGAVIDGYHRDTPKVSEQNWPVFSRGSYAQDAGVRATVIDYRVGIEIDGVKIYPGDLIFGDIDGVVVIPKEVEAEVLERSFQKASAENVVRKEIAAGMSSTDAFKKYGIL